MDNLRLEHSQPGTHHLLNFSPPIDQFSAQLKKPNSATNLHTQPLPSTWDSLWADPSPPPLKNGLQSPEHHPSGGDAWNVSVDPILQLKHGNTIALADFSHHVDASMDALRVQSPSLHLDHGSTALSAEFPLLAAAQDVVRGDDAHHSASAHMNAFRGDNIHHSLPAASAFGKDSSHFSGVLVATPLCVDNGSSSPVSVVPGQHQHIPIVRKQDGISGQMLGFPSLSRHETDESEMASLKDVRDGVAMVKTEVMGESTAGRNGSDGDGRNGYGFFSEEKGVIVKKEDGGVTIASLEDGSIGLKLGKRTYYAGGEEAGRRANSNPTCNGSGKANSSNSKSYIGNSTTTTAGAAANTTTTTTTTTNNTAHNNSGNTNNRSSNGPNKKQKGSSVSAVVPSCQAEGCTADLSGAKDYHRRHKVCEHHSKASKAKVNNIEQRFCQQCSRFHVLSAFDEGKRSCRRRLAGHNERRRRPPPEPMPFLSHGSLAYFADSRASTSLRDHPYFLQQRRASMVPAIDNSGLARHLGLAGFAQQETTGNYHALELHHFMQGLPPGGRSGLGMMDGSGALMLAAGNGLALSNASSLTMPPSSSPLGLIPPVSSEMAISGRALSLLSSSFSSPETMSISLGRTPPSIDQFLSETHVLAPSRQVAPISTSTFISGIGTASAQHGTIGHNNSHTLNSLTSSSSGCSAEMDQGEPPSMSGFEGRSMFMIHAENGFQNLQEGGNSHHSRPMLDLMQISSGENGHRRQQPDAELSYADLQGLSIFGRPSIM